MDLIFFVSDIGGQFRIGQSEGVEFLVLGGADWGGFVFEVAVFWIQLNYFHVQIVDLDPQGGDCFLRYSELLLDHFQAGITGGSFGFIGKKGIESIILGGESIDLSEEGIFLLIPGVVLVFEGCHIFFEKLQLMFLFVHDTITE